MITHPLLTTMQQNLDRGRNSSKQLEKERKMMMDNEPASYWKQDGIGWLTACLHCVLKTSVMHNTHDRSSQILMTKQISPWKAQNPHPHPPPNSFQILVAVCVSAHPMFCDVGMKYLCQIMDILKGG